MHLTAAVAGVEDASWLRGTAVLAWHRPRPCGQAHDKWRRHGLGLPDMKGWWMRAGLGLIHARPWLRSGLHVGGRCGHIPASLDHYVSAPP